MPRYFEFEVALTRIQPRIWQRFLLDDPEGLAVWPAGRRPEVFDILKVKAELDR